MQLTKTRAFRPVVSPDGEMIAYHYLDPEVEKSRWRIGIVLSKGGPQLKRFDFPADTDVEVRPLVARPAISCLR